ncbi:caspase-3-like [Ornithodoros turicata]|uniref:caspase-3-like n=1 Tax=Ornithodoros turicata TaxID=34597 RepID=UPI00313A1917
MAEDKQDSLPASGGSCSLSSSEKTYSDGTDAGAEGVVSAKLNDNYYPRRYKKMQCIIFNIRKFYHLNEEEIENTEDVQRLKLTLESIGFICTYYENKEAWELYDILQKLAKSNDDLAQTDGFLCWIITHGDEHTLHASDRALELDSILKPFAGDKCPGLFGKPKLFFVQAMNKTSKSICVADAYGGPASEPDIPCRIPAMADFYLAFSSAPGFFESGDEEDLSHFVKMVTKVLKEHVPQDPVQVDLSSLMARIVDETRGYFVGAKGRSGLLCYQLPCAMSTLTRHVTFSKLR